MKRVVTGITSAILVVMGIWVVYKKVKRNFNTAAGIVETLSGEDSTVRWTLPADTASVFLVKHQNHTNVAEVLNAVNFKLQGKRLKMEGTTESIVEDGRFFVSPSYKGAVEVNGLWDWSDSKQEAEAMSFASELSRQLNTLVVVALMGDDTESGVYAVFENGERRFRMKRWYRITSLRQGDLKEFVERDGVEWAKQHGYVPDPDDVLTGDNDAISFGDVNELTLKLGIDLSDAPDDQISLVLRDSAPASPAQPKASSQKH